MNEIRPPREPIRQALFQRSLEQALQLSPGYSKVAVLIIRWDESIDDFNERHTKEIARLQKIFVDQYGYMCKVHSIQNFRNPQVDLNRAILNHIFEHDGPNNLLIFYYTGHGDHSGENGLELSANQNFTNISANHKPTAFWNRAEEPICHDMEGDALSILDCCMASTAGMKRRNGALRAYQLLAASAAGAPTCGPGVDSFTTALCESLIELLKEAGSGTFYITQLVEKINTKRRLQACLLWDRLRAFRYTVRLGRLEQCHYSGDSFPNADPEQSSLLLRFSFKTCDLEDDQIKRLAEKLSYACHDAKILLRRIDWVQMTTVDHDAERNLRIYQNDDLPNDGLIRISERRAVERRFLDFYQATKTIIVAQRIIKAFRRRQAERNRLTWHMVSMSVLYELKSVTILEIIALTLTYGLMYVRDERTGQVMWGLMVAWMLTWGPCKALMLPASRHRRNHVR